MLVEKAGCVFMGLIVYITVLQGQANDICALKGSSVDLHCSAHRPTSNMKWFTAYRDEYTPVLNELSADGNRVTYNMSAESNFTVTIKNLTESDENVYCCKETDNLNDPELCWGNRIELHVADIQVKVIPSTEGQTVTLMCSTSCPLTEHPAGYIWYKNTEFLYQDWSPWYQQLVSSEETVTYSCAIRGYEDLRAPQVSVDSVTPTCFTVTYAEGRMCSSQQKPEDEPCSITYPRKVHVQRSPSETIDYVTMTCSTSCPPTNIVWYRKRMLITYNKSQHVVPNNHVDSFFCALKGHEDLHSDEVCVKDGNCLIVNYVTRRICALERSSVNISSQYSYPNYLHTESKFWYKTNITGKVDGERLTEAAGRVEYHDDNMKKQHILKIHKLRKNDSAEYTFKPQKDGEVWKKSDLPGVTLVVTGLKVKFTPSAEVTEGQRVTLTCSTRCPLPDNTTYIWFFNSRPLTPKENQTKHLFLNPVRSQDTGNYSCAVTAPQNTTSREKTLSVQSRTTSAAAAAAGVGAALLVIMPLAAFLWIRKKRTSVKSPRTETSDNMEEVNPGHEYEDISPRPAEPDDSHYSRVNFSKNNTDILYSTVQPHPPHPQDPEHVPYAVVHLSPT